jgi:hypothetical protein
MSAKSVTEIRPSRFTSWRSVNVSPPVRSFRRVSSRSVALTREGDAASPVSPTRLPK